MKTAKIITLKHAKELSVKMYNDGINRTKYPPCGYTRLVKTLDDNTQIWLTNTSGKLRVDIYKSVNKEDGYLTGIRIPNNF
jgi:hypothetical protein